MNIKIFENFIKVEFDGIQHTKNLVLSKKEFEACMSTLDDFYRIDINDIEKELQSVILNCLDGKFIQKPKDMNLIKSQINNLELEGVDFNNYFHFEDEVIKISPKILNYIIFDK